MLTLRQLAQSSQRLRQKVNPTGQFGITQVVPSPNMKAIAYMAEFNALTDQNMEYYQTACIFHDLMFSMDKTDEVSVSIEIFTGLEMFVEKPSFSRTPVQVFCTCKDFYYVWWFYNNQYGAHAGAKLPPYTRKTPAPPVGKPYANPLKVAGLCKHLAQLTLYLGKNAIMTV